MEFLLIVLFLTLSLYFLYKSFSIGLDFSKLTKTLVITTSIALISVLLHELLGHALLAYLLGVPIVGKEIIISAVGQPLGAYIQIETTDPEKLALIALGGPIVNAVLAIIFFHFSREATGTNYLICNSGVMFNAFISLGNAVPAVSLIKQELLGTDGAIALVAALKSGNGLLFITVLAVMISCIMISLATIYRISVKREVII